MITNNVRGVGKSTPKVKIKIPFERQTIYSGTI